jgi:hypothetical protein
MCFDQSSASRTALRPVAVPGDEALDRGQARALRHDDLDATAGKHAHRHASRAPADAHVPRHADLTVGPERQLQRVPRG